LKASSSFKLLWAQVSLLRPNIHAIYCYIFFSSKTAQYARNLFE
jgi:hypothetical protein